MLASITHEHHGRIMERVDQLPGIADRIRTSDPTDLRTRLDEEYAFVTGQLIPHMEATETNIFPQLERLLEDERAMAPIRREHNAVRHLVADLGRLRERVGRGPVGPADDLALRRILYRLYAILKVHLAEEELYLGVIEHGLSPDEKAALARGMEHAASVAV